MPENELNGLVGKFEENAIYHLGTLDPAGEDGNNYTAEDTRRACSEFSQEIIRPLDDIAERQDSFPYPLWKQLGEQGFKGIIVPEEYGGMGRGLLDLCVATQEIARASGSIAVSFVCDQALCTRQIITYGTEEQKQKYLPGLANGDLVGALAMSEPEAGTDVMSMRTNAKKVEGGYIINGSKTWITNGARVDQDRGQLTTADVLVLYAKTSDNPTRLTTFILDGHTKGFNAGNVIEKATTNGSDTATLFFDNCFVPDESVLGQVNKGAHILMDGLNSERLVFAANTLGVAQAALEETSQYLRQRIQGGMPVLYNQEVALDFARMYAQVEMAQNNMLSLAASAQSNPEKLTNRAAAAAFLVAGDIAKQVTDKCVYYLGGNGQTKAYRARRQDGVTSLLQVGAGSRFVRSFVIARDIIPGYARHVSNTSAMRDIFAAALGVSTGELDSQNLAKMLAEGRMSVAIDQREEGPIQQII